MNVGDDLRHRQDTSPSCFYASSPSKIHWSRVEKQLQVQNHHNILPSPFTEKICQTVFERLANGIKIHLILLREPSTDDDLPPRRRHRCAFFLSFIYTTCKSIFIHIAFINPMSFNSILAGCVVVPVAWMEEDQEYSVQGQPNLLWLHPGKIYSLEFTFSPICLQNS